MSTELRGLGDRHAMYDDIAVWYDRKVRESLPVHALVLPAIAELTGDVRGSRVCDLGCGQGILARQLAAAGATVLGVDLSERLLEAARGYERAAPLGVAYIQDDAQRLEACASESFDGVVCCLALMDVPDLRAALAAVARVLREGGWFVLAITHPAFQLPRGDGLTYFDECHWYSDNRQAIRGRVGAHHRTLGTYLNVLAQAGFLLERVLEPRAEGALAEQAPGYALAPATLVARTRKLAALNLPERSR